eukprot:scaffold131406_cov63-Phaeocystis_antarctica.AAC.2
MPFVSNADSKRKSVPLPRRGLGRVPYAIAWNAMATGTANAPPLITIGLVFTCSATKRCFIKGHRTRASSRSSASSDGGGRCAACHRVKASNTCSSLSVASSSLARRHSSHGAATPSHASWAATSTKASVAHFWAASTTAGSESASPAFQISRHVAGSMRSARRRLQHRQGEALVEGARACVHKLEHRLEDSGLHLFQHDARCGGLSESNRERRPHERRARRQHDAVRSEHTPIHTHLTVAERPFAPHLRHDLAPRARHLLAGDGEPRPSSRGGVGRGTRPLRHRSLLFASLLAERAGARAARCPKFEMAARMELDEVLFPPP